MKKKFRDAVAVVYLFTMIAFIWAYEKCRGKPLNFK